MNPTIPNPPEHQWVSATHSPSKSTALNAADNTQLNEPKVATALDKLPEKQTVKQELGSTPKEIKKESDSFFKNAFGSLMGNRNNVAGNAIALCAVIISPIALSGAILGNITAKAINAAGGNVSEKEFTRAGLVVGSLGLIGIAFALNKMRENQASKNKTVKNRQPEVLKPIESKNEPEKKLSQRINDLRNYSQQGTLTEEEVETRQSKIINDLKEKQNEGTISEDFASDALGELKKVKKDLKIAPQIQQKTFDGIANNHARVLDRSIEVNKFLLRLSDNLPAESNSILGLSKKSKEELSDIEKTIVQEKFLMDNLNNLKNDKKTKITDKLNRIQGFKGAANNEANLKTLDNLNKILSKDKSEDQKTAIERSINTLKEYIDLETNGKLREYTTDAEWEDFKNQEAELNLKVALAYLVLSSYAAQLK